MFVIFLYGLEEMVIVLEGVKDLKQVQAIYSAGPNLAVLVDNSLTSDEFDEIYDCLYDEGIDVTNTTIIIERKSIVDSQINNNETLNFIMNEGEEIYNIAS